MLTFPEFKPRFARDSWCLPRVLEHQAEKIGDRPFLQWTDKNPALSFAEVNRLVNRLAHGLANIGVKKGDRIILFLPNSLEYLLLWFAANKIGAVEVPINPEYRGQFFEHQARISGATTLVAPFGVLSAVEESLPTLPAIERLIVWHEEIFAPGLPQSIGQAQVHLLDNVFSADDSNPNVQLAPQELAAILYTSGTTGPSKGVLMTHAQLYLFSECDAQLVRLTDQDVYLTAFPFFHANAQFLTIYPCLIYGTHCVLYRRFSASEWVERLIATQATITNSVGVVLPFIMAQTPSENDRKHKLRCLFSAPTPHDMMPAFKQRFGEMAVVEAFGQTEICLPMLAPYDAKRPKGACGVQVNQWFDVKIVDPETDLPVPDGQVGELVVRAKAPWTLNQGYVNMPEKTVEAWRNLWFHTGDGMRRDADGWFYFVDRIKDSLRRRGENISSFEVEEPIRAHPVVADVAVIGVPADEEAGEDEVKACIVLKDGQSVTPQEIVDWCVARLPGFAVPRYVQFYTSLPKTPSERVQKNKLRDKAARVGEWDRAKQPKKQNA